MGWRLATLTLCAITLVAVSMWPASQAAPPKEPAFGKTSVEFLQNHCVTCHNVKKKRADIALDHLKTAEDLVKHRKLVDKVLRVLKTGEMPPNPRPRPPVAELDGFLASVQGTLAHHDRTAPPDPGRVTIRRLNRTEYNNTIRDLTGVDFNPAEDFPSDDVGHGFDNIGDVLTLSPVLMERYLGAAEAIMSRAIVAKLPKPPERWMGSRYLEPGQPNPFKFRPLDPKQLVLHTPYKLSLDGEYVWRARVWAKMIDKEPVKVAVLDGDRELQRFEVTAPEKAPIVLEVKTNLTAGDHRFFLKLLNPSGERNLHVEWFYLRGPADTRPLTQRKLLATTGMTDDEKSREVLQRFASRAYRRPVTDEELNRLLSFAQNARKRGDSWESSMQLAMQAVLVSPKFLFRPELDDRPIKGDKPIPLDEYLLASRLSYFLWSSMPDEELFALAAKGQLRENLDGQVKRMLKDARSSALTENFAMQWLQLRRLKTHTPDPTLFPRFDEPLRAAMLRETELFFDAIVKEDRSVLDLIDARFTFVNERLARHYALTDTLGNTFGRKGKGRGRSIRGREFVRVELQEGDPRGGLLTQASILTVTSNPTRTSPVKRGRWVLEQILGTPPPPAPPDVPELDEKKVLTGSLRQQMEQHRKNPACAACHAKMDPLGFAFENFDAVGAFRTQEAKQPIDVSGELPGGRKFNGPAELKQILKEQKELVVRNLAEKLLIYALGRGLEPYDQRTIDQIVANTARNEYRFSALVTEITKSLPFTHRRPKEPGK